MTAIERLTVELVRLNTILERLEPKVARLDERLDAVERAEAARAAGPDAFTISARVDALELKDARRAGQAAAVGGGAAGVGLALVELVKAIWPG